MSKKGLFRYVCFVVAVMTTSRAVDPSIVMHSWEYWVLYVAGTAATWAFINSLEERR